MQPDAWHPRPRAIRLRPRRSRLRGCNGPPRGFARPRPAARIDGLHVLGLKVLSCTSSRARLGHLDRRNEALSENETLLRRCAHTCCFPQSNVATTCR